jgi:hypothetical protein
VGGRAAKRAVWSVMVVEVLGSANERTEVFDCSWQRLAGEEFVAPGTAASAALKPSARDNGPSLARLHIGWSLRRRSTARASAGDQVLAPRDAVARSAVAGTLPSDTGSGAAPDRFRRRRAGEPVADRLAPARHRGALS